MAIVLKDILIDTSLVDYNFTNPVRLMFGFEMARAIGQAHLKRGNESLFADLIIDDEEVDYQRSFPSFAFNPINNTITTLSLVYMTNSDKRIKKICEQLQNNATL